ncbi:MAG: hypothetical protein GX233_00590 [Erysipelothrix sp.]|nr:hypothetical protein [Erysipelothrix sp.]
MLRLRAKVCALNCRKGSILLYSLGFFIFFVSWLSFSLGVSMSLVNKKNYINLIEQRLDIEAMIISHYREYIPNNSCEGDDGFDSEYDEDFDLEFDDECEVEIDPGYQFQLHSSSVSCMSDGETIFVNVVGDIRMDFKYDIIEDGSFKHSQWED